MTTGTPSFTLLGIPDFSAYSQPLLGAKTKPTTPPPLGPGLPLQPPAPAKS